MKQQTALIDTNLLVLLSVGTCDRDFILKHKRTNAFTLEDFDLLLSLLSNFKSIVVTPNVLTECSNLCAQTGEPMRSRILLTLKALTEFPEEITVPSAKAYAHPSYLRLGLTDAAIHVGVGHETVLTVDLDLFLSLEASGKSALNFNRMREYGWGNDP